MNRLVIIGNGFDLAHGLPTGYSHFMNWFWENFKKNYKTPKFQNLIELNESYSGVLEYNEIKSYNDLMSSIKKYAVEYGYQFHNAPHEGFFQLNRERKSIITYHNYFFRVINQEYSIQSWIDIENEYYQLLKKCLKEEDNSGVKKLNKEFEQVKKLLEEYLTTEVEAKFELKVNEKILDTLLKTQYNEREESILFRELQSEMAKTYSSKKRERIVLREKFIIEQVKYLNFNYTSLLQKAISFYDEDVYQCNQIHGELNNKDNLINFGFGDEMDDDYKTIEKKDDNEYLRNIKSFAYLNTPNYKSLIDFLESGKFQVYIMGHSCGLSDRILLNKVFEHQNCISIKIYYYQNGDWDNYTDIAQNVSRHFNKKEMMRERIVNKTYCEPLPQTKLPLKDTSAGSV